MNCACKAGTGFQHSENLIQGICFNMAVGKRSAGNTCIIGLIRDVKHGIEVALNQCLVDRLFLAWLSISAEKSSPSITEYP